MANENIIGVSIDQLDPVSSAPANSYVIVRINGVDKKILKADFSSDTQAGASIPDWDQDTIFNTTDNKYAVYDLKIWKSKIDGNQGNTPAEDANWTEVSRSEASAIKEWTQGIFQQQDVVVKRLGKLVELINPARPYESQDIEAEIAAGDWRYIPIGITGESGSTYQNTYASIQGMLTGQGDQTAGGVQFVSDASKDFPTSGQGDPTVETPGSWAEYVYLGTTNGDLTDYRKRAEEESVEGGSGPEGPAIAERYPTWALLLADQAAQESGKVYFAIDASGFSTVDSGYAYFEYLGTTNGNESDYRKLTEGESMDLDLSNKADKDTDAVLGNLAEFDANGNPIDSGVDPDQLVNISQIDLSDINEGENKILTVLKEVGTGNPVFEGGVGTVDKIATASILTALADEKEWGQGNDPDIITIYDDTGDTTANTDGNNANGELGRPGQEQMSQTKFLICISADNNSATWRRNRSNVLLTDTDVISELEGGGLTWTNKFATVTNRSVPGSIHVSSAGVLYICTAPFTWYRRNDDVPQFTTIAITDGALKAEIEAHDFGATPQLTPVATEKGKHGQEHYWDDAGTLKGAKKVLIGGSIVWIKVL